jgi:hypothetical protein
MNPSRSGLALIRRVLSFLLAAGLAAWLSA